MNRVLHRCIPVLLAKARVLVVALLSVGLLLPGVVQASTCTSTGACWSSYIIWGAFGCHGGLFGPYPWAPPLSTDSVYFNPASITTMDSDRTVVNVDVGTGGTTSLCMNGFTLTVTGNFLYRGEGSQAYGASGVGGGWGGFTDSVSCTDGYYWPDVCSGGGNNTNDTEGTVVLAGSSAQTISSGGNITQVDFYNLTVNNAAGVLMQTDVVVRGTLTLTNGVLDTNGHTLTVQGYCPNNIVIGSGTIKGTLQMNFPATDPVTCTFPVQDTNGNTVVSITKHGSNNGTLTVSSSPTAPDNAAAIGIDQGNDVNHYWTIAQGTAGNWIKAGVGNALTSYTALPNTTPYDVTFKFCNTAGTCSATEKDGGADNTNVAGFIVAQNKTATAGSINWTGYVSPTNNGAASTTAVSSATGAVTGFGWFTVGAPRFDHIRLQHDGQAKLCIPEPITVMTCANTSCSIPYPYAETITLATPPTNTSWASGSVTTAATTGSVATTLSASVSTTYTLPVTSTASPKSPLAIGDCWNTALLSTSCSLQYTDCMVFNANEADAATIGSRLYTKLAGVAFPHNGIDLHYGTTTADDTTYNSAPTKLELVDDNSNAVCASKTALTGVTFKTSGGVVTTSPTFISGHYYHLGVLSANAAAKVKVRISDTTLGVTSCSSDSFAIRPTQLAPVISYASGISSPLVSGQINDTNATGFILTATAKSGWSGNEWNNVTPGSPVASLLGGYTGGGYTGTPTVNVANVYDWNSVAIPSAALTGSSAALPGRFATAVTPLTATAVTATGTFYYDDFGLVDFNRPNTVVDQTFAGPATNDTTGLTSNDQFNADCLPGANGYNNVADTNGRYGCWVGSPKPATTAAGQTYRFRPDHYTASVSAPVAPTGCTFTYIGQPFSSVTLNLAAQSAHGTTLTRLTSTAILTPPSVPVFSVSSYNYATNIPPSTTATATGLGISGLPPLNWTNGVYGVSGSTTVALTSAIPVAPYNGLVLGVTISDPDSVQITSCNGSPVSEATCMPSNNYTLAPQVVLGILKIENSYGSELLDLFVPVKALYYDGSSWKTNTLDNSCTMLSPDRIAISAAVNQTGALASHPVVQSGLWMFNNNSNGGPPAQAGQTPSQSVALVGGMAMIKIPNPSYTGGVDIALNLGMLAQDKSCAKLQPLSAEPATDLFYLRGNWCGSAGYTKDPNARITFGTPRNSYIYMREKY